MCGWLGGWAGGWVGGWVGVRVCVRVRIYIYIINVYAYSGRRCRRCRRAVVDMKALYSGSSNGWRRCRSSARAPVWTYRMWINNM